MITSACTPPQTGMIAADTPHPDNTTNTTKVTKFTVPEEKLDKVNKTQICLNQIAVLKEEKTADEYKLLQLNSAKQKLSMELQFKKDNKAYEKELEDLVEQMRSIDHEKEKLKNDIDSKKSAVRLLEEKCRIKS